MKKIIRLTENDIHGIVKESIKKTIQEAQGTMPRHYQATINTLKDNFKTEDEFGSGSAQIGAALNKFKQDISLAMDRLDTIMIHDYHLRDEKVERSWEYNRDKGIPIPMNVKPSGNDLDKYYDALRKSVNRLYKIANRMKELLIMNQGGIPDKGIHNDYNEDY